MDLHATSGALPHRAVPTAKHSETLSAVIAYNKHGGYCVPLSCLHRPASRAIMTGEIWEKETLKLMCRHGHGDIVHAGTFFGDFLPAFSRASSDGIVWAFEPVRENFRCAEITIRINDLQNVRLRNAAVGASEEALRFATVNAAGKPLGGASHVSEEGGERVVQVVLDRAIPAERRVGVLQLDVEGYEGPALRGARELLKRNRPLVILETVPDGFADAFDYVFARKVHANSVFRPR